VLSGWARSRLSVQVGVWLRQRLMLGVLRSRPSPGEGAGRLLARVLESEALQSQALAAVFASASGGLELTLAAVLLASTAGGGLSVVALLAWIVLIGVLLRRRHRAYLAWTAIRVALTQDLVERVVGHRTRKVQESRQVQFREDDQ